MIKLSQLRVLFVLYMLAKTIVEIVLGSGICLDSIEAGGMSWLIRLFGSHFAIPILAIFSNGVLLVLGLGLFAFAPTWRLAAVGAVLALYAMVGVVLIARLSRGKE